jgi:transketolase
MVSAGAGLAKLNKIPLVGMYGFLVLRAAEQIRYDVCYQDLNVKIFATHTGVSMAPEGVTHHGVSDISILNSFPNITIIQPAFPREAVDAIFTAVLEHKGATYLRLPDTLCEDLYDQKYKFEIGKAFTLQDGHDITIISSGTMLSVAKEASDQLINENIYIRLINMSTLKPIDENAIIQAAKETKGIITIEDNDLAGGLGAQVSQIVCKTYPVKVKMFGLPNDRFTIVAPSAKNIYNYFGINVENIKKAVREMIS